MHPLPLTQYRPKLLRVMETRDFICVCLGVNWSTIERICENFDVDI